jgi:multidrug efflux pump
MILSLTTTPMMCAHLLKQHTGEEKHGVFYRASEWFFDSMLSFYRASLLWVLDNSGLMLVVLLLTIALNVVLVIRIPKGFFPSQDVGSMVGGVQGPQDASFPVMNASIQALVKVIKADPGVENVNGFVGGGGGGGGGGGNGGFIYAALKPLNVRKVSVNEIINRLRPKMNRLPVAQAFLQAGQDLRIGGRGGNALYQYTLQADNVADLAHWGPLLLTQMKRLPGLLDVNMDQQNGGLEEYVTFDRTAAARMGLTPSTLDSSLYGAFGQAEVSTIYTQLNQYYVVLEVAPQFWQSPAGLNFIYPATSTTNGPTPLMTVSKARSGTTPLQVNHTGVFPSVTVSFNLAPGLSLSDATLEINEMQAKMGLPSTIRGFFSGTLQAYQQSLSTEPILVLTALLAVYIVLGILYESLVHPLTIISTLPPASVGAMLALLVFKNDLNVISIIGIVLLIGLVKKNAIMMIDFALVAEREHGKDTEAAIFEACMLRFRPIMMTTMAALFGAIPLAFGTGTGSELRRPLGITIVGGLIVSQMLTLYTTPVIYLYMDRVRLRVMGKHHDTFQANPEGAI